MKYWNYGEDRTPKKLKVELVLESYLNGGEQDILKP